MTYLIAIVKKIIEESLFIYKLIPMEVKNVKLIFFSQMKREIQNSILMFPEHFTQCNKTYVIGNGYL